VDSGRFDALAKVLALGLTRRTATAGLALLTGMRPAEREDAVAKGKGKKGKGRGNHRGGVGAEKKKRKKTICHCESSSPASCQTIQVKKKAAAKHLRNHPFDRAGACPGTTTTPPPGTTTTTTTSTTSTTTTPPPCLGVQEACAVGSCCAGLTCLTGLCGGVVCTVPPGEDCATDCDCASGHFCQVNGCGAEQGGVCVGALGVACTDTTGNCDCQVGTVCGANDTAACGDETICCKQNEGPACSQLCQCCGELLCSEREQKCVTLGSCSLLGEECAGDSECCLLNSVCGELPADCPADTRCCLEPGTLLTHCRNDCDCCGADTQCGANSQGHENICCLPEDAACGLDIECCAPFLCVSVGGGPATCRVFP
jgi:hypothetical protein